MNYSVNQLAKLAGVSVRTLHYYDQVGLLKPATVYENGYRGYGEVEVAKLQQILFYKELDFSLEKIKQIMTAVNFDPKAALIEQRELIEIKKKRVDKLLRVIDKTIKSIQEGVTMSNDDKFSPFNDPTYQKYKQEVEERWGKEEAYKQSVERVSRMTKAEFEKVKSEGEKIVAALARLKEEGKLIGDDEVQTQIGLYYKHLHHFYDPNYEMFKALGQMYVDDARFTKFYENISPGLSEFMRDAIAYYTTAQTK